MSILQSQINELRYIKRQNLEQEAKVVGNWYRDLIRSYSVDCNYYKLKIPYPEVFKTIIDDNNLILHAYGYDPNPDYSISADMLTYMEIENDIFQLNKYGIIPNMDVNFYFDSKDFACSLAYKLGQYREYKIDNKEILCEVPEVTEETSASLFPYYLGLGYNEIFKTDIVSGKISVEIMPYEIEEGKTESKEYTIICDPYSQEWTGNIAFPSNEYIYKSFNYSIKNDDCIETLIFLTYKIMKIPVDSNTPIDLNFFNHEEKTIDSEKEKKVTPNKFKYVLKGKLHGGVLFHDLDKIGKYIDMIHPEIGDIITIDFPNESSREQYEITDCFDKQLSQDGINPLLHKYIWKCKARRYINSQENMPEENEANKQLVEKLDLIQKSDEEVASKISYYDENEDAHYGGYENENKFKDLLDIKDKQIKFNDNEVIPILSFGVKTQLITDGYNLYFKDSSGKITEISTELVKNDYKFKDSKDIQYIKATSDQLVFINIESQVLKIIEDKVATKGEIELCLNSLFDSTLKSSDKNYSGDNFYKFSNCKTLLWSTPEHLYCKLESNGKLYRIA